MGTAGDPDAEETLVFVAHHDAANGGLIFRPELTRLVADPFPAWYARQSTSPQMLRLVAAGPALAGARGAERVGACCASSARSSPPAARWPSSTSARAPSSRARTTTSPPSPSSSSSRGMLREEPVGGLRVLLVSTGSEESFMEGMRGWVRRHGPGLDPARTRVVVLETLGSPELILLEGEGMIWMTDYDAGVRDLIADSAQRAGVAAAPRPAPRVRHRRPVGAARRAARGHARLLRRVQDALQLPLAARHPAQRRLPHGGGRRPRRRGRDQGSSERASVTASSRVAISPA